MNIENFRKPVLQFSGGKDSLACLMLLKPYWDKLTLAWLNTGAAFPETEEVVRWAAKRVGSYIEMHSDQPSDLQANGWPSEVVPIRATIHGRMFEDNDAPLVQSAWECCATNIWAPTMRAMQVYGADLVIRGQRDAETRKGPVRSGDVIGGICFYHPIEDWSDQKVKDFLAEQDVELPKFYDYINTSLDCWSCTAYLFENQGRHEYMKRFHPEWAAERARRLRLIASEVDRERAFFDAEMN